MKYTLTMLNSHYEQLTKTLFVGDTENGAYLLCSLSHTDYEKRLIVREVVGIKDSHYLKKDKFELLIKSLSYASIAKRASLNNDVIVFAHSHPDGYFEFSEKDNIEEKKLLEFFSEVIPNKPHATLVLTKATIKGRVLCPHGWVLMDKIRIIGKKFYFFDEKDVKINKEIFDRQIEAFGEKTQGILNKLHIGIVGAGGTGSSVVEQLTRLGIGEISIFDGDNFESSNVNRVYGTKISDSGVNKADLAKKNSAEIGLNTKINLYKKFITEEYIAKELRNCDILFCCTDNHSSRGIIVRLMTYYYIPVFDLAVKIDSEKGNIKDVIGRLTLLFPNEACLFCRGRINADNIRAESLNQFDYEQELKDGYVPELETRSPAVIPFTTMISAFSISELIHRITGYKGEDVESTEYLLFFNDNEIRKNRIQATENCVCKKNIGKADLKNFLDLIW